MRGLPPLGWVEVLTEMTYKKHLAFSKPQPFPTPSRSPGELEYDSNPDFGFP